MIAATEAFGFSLTELAVGLAAVAYVCDRVLDATGWSRSSRTLREENEDLVRRNNELDQMVDRLGEDLKRMDGEVQTLRKTDQSAVLASLRDHEAQAGIRHERTLSVLTEIRDTLKSG